MNRKITKAEILSNIEWEPCSKASPTGQSYTSLIVKEKLISKETEINIEVSHFKSKLKNRALALLIFEYAINELLKNKNE